MNPLEQWKEVMYDNAKRRWPGLTPEEFGEAARAAIEHFPSGGASLQDGADRIEAELKKRYGEGQLTTQSNWRSND